jgi:hypothetical protein
MDIGLNNSQASRQKHILDAQDTLKNAGVLLTMYRIKKWHEYQSLRKDRGNAQWIKFRPDMFQDYHFKKLSQSDKTTLIGLMAWCDHRTGNIDRSEEELNFIIGCKSINYEDLSHFIEKVDRNDKCTVSMNTDRIGHDHSREEESREEIYKEERREDEHMTNFDQFWTSYPKKQAKGRAREYWKYIDPNLFEKIMESLEMAKSSSEWTRDAGKYIPYPSKWINDECWDDEYEAIIDISNTERMEGLGL